MAHPRSLAVHDAPRPRDPRAEGQPHGLMPEAHAQQRPRAGEPADQFTEMPARSGAQGPRRNHHRRRLQCQASATVMASLQKTRTSAPMAARACKVVE